MNDNINPFIFMVNGFEFWKLRFGIAREDYIAYTYIAGRLGQFVCCEDKPDMINRITCMPCMLSLATVCYPRSPLSICIRFKKKTDHSSSVVILFGSNAEKIIMKMQFISCS